MSSPRAGTFAEECAVDALPAFAEFEVSPEGPIHPIDHDLDRSFDSTVDIHIDDGEDPFADDESDYGENERDDTKHASRKVSENSFSTMPDDLSVHDSFIAPIVDGGRIGSSPLRKARASEYTRLISPSQQRLMSSRTSSRGAPLSPLAHNRVSSSHQTPSRNGSAKQVQLSSPERPFSQSPRSARVRKREGTPQNFLSTPTRSVTTETTAHRTPSYANPLHAQTPSRSGTAPHPHRNPQKEYPLVLLHCSISTLALPYDEHLLATYLPLATQENLAMLREKLSATVLERGMLLPHPGDDYEVLEERVLESLELKAPRVGRCGHFLGSGTTTPRNKLETDGTGNGDVNVVPPGQVIEGINGTEAKPNACTDCSCNTCGSHISHNVNGPQRRWDIRVYAANGLMRSGAWGAAWRDMEKVDIEIGVWIPDEVRNVLEAEAIREAERWEESVVEKYQGDGSEIVQPVEDSMFEEHVEAPRAESPEVRAQRPLSELLLSYVKRTLVGRPEILLHIFIAVLGIIYLTRTSASTSTAPVVQVKVRAINTDDHNNCDDCVCSIGNDTFRDSHTEQHPSMHFCIWRRRISME